MIDLNRIEEELIRQMWDQWEIKTIEFNIPADQVSKYGKLFATSIRVETQTRLDAYEADE